MSTKITACVAYEVSTFWGLVVLFLLSPAFLAAQSVEVVDETTLKAISNVYIFNNDRNKIASTDNSERADLAKFSSRDTLNFQHPGFKRLTILYSRLKSSGFKIELRTRSVRMNEVFVTASKRKQRREDIPPKITRISEEQVQFKNPQTSADLLQGSGKVFVQKSQLGGGSPMIRSPVLSLFLMLTSIQNILIT